MKIVIHYTKKSAAVACAIILLIIGGVIALSIRNGGTGTSPRIASSPVNVLAQPGSEEPVNVTVEHDTKQSTEKTHVFTVVLDTHSGDLSTFDVQKNITYRSPQGKETSPQSIGGDKETHHRTITVTFTNTTLPGNVVIKNLRGISERMFPFQGQ